MSRSWTWGRGTSIVISSPTTKEAIVVDCADTRVVADYLRASDIRHLRGVIITHLHADHFRGVPQLLDNCGRLVAGGCELLMFNHLPSQSRRRREELMEDGDGHAGATDGADAETVRGTAFRRLLEWGKRHPFRCSSASVGAQGRPLNGSLWQHVELLYPTHIHLADPESSNLNDTSVVLRVRGTRATALLTGDLEVQGFRNLLSTGTDLASDVLKMPHHGGWNEDPSLILEAVKPSIAVVSVGAEGQRYGHPAALAFQRIRERAPLKLLCTQGTASCDKAGKADRTATVTRLASRPGGPPRSRAGRPCAGSIVVELGDDARVLWPERAVHRGVVLGQFREHQCDPGAPDP